MCTKEKCKKISIKRYFLPFIFIPFILFIEDSQNYAYIPIVWGFSAFFLFWNFPWIVYYTASKPLYYEDLFIDEKALPNYDVNPKIKYKFKSILEWVLIVTNSLLVAALSDYWYYKFLADEFTAIELLGVTGGIIKLFQIVNNTISRIMLKILRRILKTENRELQKKQTIELKKIIKIKSLENFDMEQKINTNNLVNKKIKRERIRSI